MDIVSFLLSKSKHYWCLTLTWPGFHAWSLPGLAGLPEEIGGGREFRLPLFEVIGFHCALAFCKLMCCEAFLTFSYILLKEVGVLSYYCACQWFYPSFHTHNLINTLAYEILLEFWSHLVSIYFGTSGPSHCTNLCRLQSILCQYVLWCTLREVLNQFPSWENVACSVILY